VESLNLRSWVAIAVVIIWTVSAIVAFFTGNFEELGIVTPVMMIVTGFLFGFRHEYVIQDTKDPHKKIVVESDDE
jgi:uncharacterized membrane-anchored protein